MKLGKKKILLLLTTLLFSIPCLTSCTATDQISTSYKYCTMFNDFITECKDNGTNKEIESKWFSTDILKNDLDFTKLRGTNGTIRVACATFCEPIAYLYNNNYSGLTFDYLYRFGEKYGYKYIFTNYNDTSSIVASVSTNKSDIGACAISITDERAESVSFSLPYYDNELLCVIKKTDSLIYTSKETLKGKSIGVLSGATSDLYAAKDIEDCKILYFNGISDLVSAIKKGSIAAFYCDSSVVNFLLLSETELMAAYSSNSDDQYGFVFPKFGYQTVSELKNKNVGYLNGSNYISYIDSKVDVANKVPCDSVAELTSKLASKELDAFVVDNFTLYWYKKNYPDLYTFNKPIANVDTGAIFPKTTDGDKLKNEFNLFLKDFKKSGDYDNLINKWLNLNDDDDVTIPYKTLPASTGKTLRLVVPPEYYPFAFTQNNSYAGIDIEFVYYFCKSQGYGLEISSVDFKDFFSSISSYDMGIGSITITSDRADIVSFSDTIYDIDVVIAVYAKSGMNKDFFQSVGDSFYNTFVKEERWKMFFSGTGVTLLISFASILIGLVLGFLLYILCKDGGKISAAIMKIYTSLMHGIPMVVILMIFYYIIFGNTSLSGVVISIIAFSLVFAASVYGMLKNSVAAIDKGQFEAAYSLGFTRNKTFFKVILPQTFKQFLPQLEGGVVSLVKETAIVGYIAVEDITKVSDIVRSRTYESFFPLIVTAILYFALAYLLVYVIKIIAKRINSKKRKTKKLLKGVIDHD